MVDIREPAGGVTGWGWKLERMDGWGMEGWELGGWELEGWELEGADIIFEGNVRWQNRMEECDGQFSYLPPCGWLALLLRVRDKICKFGIVNFCI